MDAQQILQLYLALWLGVLGAVLGSFLDCAAGRYAAGAGWIPAGRSRCGHCGHVLGPADLVPVFSFLLRRGKCRHCGGPIPRECLAAEAAGAALFAALALKFGPCPELVMWLLLGGDPAAAHPSGLAHPQPPRPAAAGGGGCPGGVPLPDG